MEECGGVILSSLLVSNNSNNLSDTESETEDEIYEDGETDSLMM